MKFLICLFLFCILHNCKILDAKVLGTMNKALFFDILYYIDPEIEPCDDFYKFACGNFLKSTEITGSHSEAGISGFILYEIQKNLITRLEEQVQPNEPKPIIMVKNLYKACMNKTAIEEKGLTPVLQILKTLGGWPVLEGDSWRDEDFDWKQLVYKLKNLGYSYNYFFNFNVAVDEKNNSKRMIEIDQAILALSREYLVKGNNEKILSAYYNYMVDIAVVFGAERTRAEKELKQSLEFEMKLANISLPIEKRRIKSTLYNPMTVKELAGNYTSIPWKEYFNTILKPNVEIDEDEVVIVNVPTYFKEFEKLMQLTPKRTQANYAMWRAVEYSLTYLPDDIRKRELEYLAVLTGITERLNRMTECYDLTVGNMGLIVSALYVREYFDEESKRSVTEIVNDIRKEFIKILQKADWMDEKTKKSALEKAESMSTKVGYPNELLDDKKLEGFYEKLEIRPNDYFQAMLNVSIFLTEYFFSQLKKPANSSDWVHEGHTSVDVNAYYIPYKNSIKIPAGILQGVFFGKNRPQYMNYGGIGSTIGHEIIHGFDDEGRQYDKEGNLMDWWEPETKEKYLRKAECIINQYGNYTAEEVGLNLNGFNTQGENIADNGGLKISYLAYQEWVNRNGFEFRLPYLNYTPSQLFWISAALTSCIKYKPESLKDNIMTGFHVPEEFRVLGSFSNRPEFSQDFNCPLGSRMNPIKKCSVW